MLKLFEQFLPVASIRLCRRDVRFFFKRCQWRLVTAPNPQRAISKDPFRVDHMHNYFLYAPLLRRIAEQLLAFVQRIKESQRLG